MKRNQVQIACFTMLFTVSSLSAQIADTLTLKQCMECAVAHSANIKINHTEQSDAQIQRREAILQAFTPSISAGTSVYYNFGRAVDPESNTFTDVTSFNNNYAVNASMTVFDGLSTINRIRIAKTVLKMGLSKEVQLRNELCLAVMEAYFNVQFQTQMAAVLHSQVEAAGESLKLVTIQYEQGQKGYADKVQLEAELADKEYQALTTENRLKDALLTLKDLMLWPVDEQLALQQFTSESDTSSEWFASDVLSTSPLSPSASEEISAYAKEFHPTSLIA